MHACLPFLTIKQVSTAVPKPRIPHLSYPSEILLMHQIWRAAVLFKTKHLKTSLTHFCYTAVAAVDFYNEIDWENDQAEKKNQEEKNKDISCSSTSRIQQYLLNRC